VALLGFVESINANVGPRELLKSNLQKLACICEFKSFVLLFPLFLEGLCDFFGRFGKGGNELLQDTADYIRGCLFFLVAVVAIEAGNAYPRPSGNVI
jgi:hypothetical protein